MRCLLMCTTILLCSNSSNAADEKLQTVMVIHDHVKLGVEGRVKSEAQFGTLLNITKEHGAFFWVTEHRAWIAKKDVLPLRSVTEYLTKRIEKNENAVLLQARGLAHVALGDPAQAIEDFDRALSLDPALVSVYVNRGNAWKAQNELQKALDDYTAAIQFEPKHAIAFNNRSMVWSELGERQKAMQDVTRAIELDPTFADAFQNRGVYHREKGEFEQAIEDYSEAIRLRPTFAVAFANRGFAWKALGKPKAALKDYTVAIALAPDLAQSHNDLAWLLATSPEETIRDGKRAVEHARKACEQTEFHNWNFLDTLAAAYAEVGDFSSAVQWCEKALAKAPSEAAKSACEARLGLYKEHRPFRETKGANSPSG